MLIAMLMLANVKFQPDNITIYVHVGLKIGRYVVVLKIAFLSFHNNITIILLYSQKFGSDLYLTIWRSAFN